MSQAQRKEALFPDIPKHIVGGFTPAKGVGAGWFPFEYQLDAFSGVGLATGAHSPAGELVLDLGLSGWHTLHFCHNPMLHIWLDGEKGFRELDGMQPGNGIRDFLLHSADLTGRKLHIAPKRGTAPREAELFYIRAVPCDGPRHNHRNLIATEDGHGVFWRGMDSIREIYKWFYPYRDSDFFRVLWGVFGGGDVTTRSGPTVATRLPWKPEHLFYADEKIFNDSVAKVAAQGSILDTVMDAAREVEMEVHFYFRVAAFAGVFPHHGNASQFYAEHPEFHCRDEHGRPLLRLSYAFPEVQDHLLAYFEELLEHDPDGLCMAFNRGLPVMVCEQPVLDAFEERHGRPPVLPDEVDSDEMLAVRHELLAAFMARVHELLAGRGKALSCIAPRNFHENRLRGLDVELLLKRGMLESVAIGAGHEDNPLYTARHGQPPLDHEDFDPILALKAIGTGKVYLGGSSGHGTFFPRPEPKTSARRMKRVLESGLDGGYFWDANEWFTREWDMMRYFGDRQFLEDVINDRVPPPKVYETISVHDVVADRYNPWNAC